MARKRDEYAQFDVKRERRNEMLKLICGASGSGKTAHLIDEIRSDIEQGIRCFLLVPE